ncbi:MAG TPA: NAD(P)-dependent oxidoreductase [Terracidiphilus sp.]|nr:NAD(P)-dependent oxidoreductase [Terracidiphilus sp.]
MNVVLYGASGMIGSRILKELLHRGHTVTAVVRNPERVTALGAYIVLGDMLDPATVAATSKGREAAISAYAPPRDDSAALWAATHSLLSGLATAGVRRLIVVGGAGSLEIAPGLQAVDAPGFPAEWKTIALAHREALALLKSANLDWTYFSPAGLIQPGLRTGKFRLAGTQLLTDANGDSLISAEDYAIALVDELEKPQHIREQFTIGY